MSQTVKATYRDGNLELSEPLDLAEGESVEVTVSSRRDHLLAILGDLVMIPDPSAKVYTEAEIEEMERQVREGFRGVTLSDVIIEERREGP